MIGRLADLFRFVWGLLYWNTRKSWFRWRGGRSPCPCQSPSDSGRPYETACEACVHWDRPARFRRVCPLLAETPDGLRCSVDTLDVRPFWGRALAYYGGSLAALYLATALAIFAFLRLVGYPISIVHLVWPGSWHRVGQVRGWYFMDRANRSFQAGRPAEGMLYLQNAYEFDPTNWEVSLAYAQKLQLSQAARSNAIYSQLLQHHPERGAEISRIWFRALLARADFAAVRDLARVRVLDDPSAASVWMRALILASRATDDTAALEQIAATNSSAATPWRRLVETELLLRHQRRAEALAALRQPWTSDPPFALFYQLEQLVALGEGLEAVGYAELYRNQLDDAARALLLLDAYASLNANQPRQQLISTLLQPPLHPTTVSLLCAHLVRYPDLEAFGLLYQRFLAQRLPLVDQTLEAYLGLFCAAGATGNWTAMQAISAQLRAGAGRNTLTLGLAESFFRGQTTQTSAAAVLPALPLSLEMTYALLERYPGAGARARVFAP